MKDPQENTSRIISYWLRHNPNEAGLEMDEYGWVSIDKVLAALDDKSISLTLEDLLDLNKSFDKIRWEINIDLRTIRATHGHSVPVVLHDKAEQPPEFLYHGTSINTV